MSILDFHLPVLAAPMAGGTTGPALVVAAAEAGSLGFLAAGYRTGADLQNQLGRVRASTDRYAVNLFAPNQVPVDAAAYAAYRDRLLPLAERYGVTLPAEPVEDDDHWRDKVDVLLADPPPLVSFTFGLPEPAAAKALHAAGVVLAQTVTSADEARQAADAGLDMVVVQGSAAGGHSGTFTPGLPPAAVPLADLVREVRNAVPLPLVAAGGLVDAAAVSAVLVAGADAVAVGTALLLAPEAGTAAPNRRALIGRDRGEPVVTWAFSGRPARGLTNSFIAAFETAAPLGYPAVHHLTSPIRRAAAAAGDCENVNIWAGVGYRAAVERPAAETLRALAAGVESG